jgi:arylsulfatase A-like enzyme
MDKFYLLTILLTYLVAIQAEIDLDSSGSQTQLENSRPNIVLIVMDDVGIGDLPPFNNDRGGARDVATPFYDSLLERNNSIRLDNYYSHSFCTPARASLLSGLYSFNTGLNGVLVPATPAGISQDIKLLPEFLKDIGYRTSMLGKWHLGNSQAKMTPVRRGFDSFTGIYGWDTDYYSKAVYELPWNEAIYLDWTTQFRNGTYRYYQEPKHSMVAITEHAVQEILSTDDTSTPLFLYLPYTAAHSPLQEDVSLNTSHCNSIPHQSRRDYCRLLLTIDSSLEKVIDSIEKSLESKQNRDTILLIVSDNGGSVYLGGSNFPYRGAKGGCFEGGIKVPGLIIEFPKSKRSMKEGKSEESQSSNVKKTFTTLFHSSDVTPTLLGILGHRYNNLNFDGLDHHCNLPIHENFKRNCEYNSNENNNKKDSREILLEFQDPSENVFSDYSLAFRSNEMKLVEGNFGDGFWYSPSNESSWIQFNFRARPETATYGYLIKGFISTFLIRLFECFTRLLEISFGRGSSDTARIFLQNSLLYSSFKYFDLSTFDGIPSTNRFEFRNSTEFTNLKSKTWLFNLSSDPFEEVNLAAKFPDLVINMRKRANEIASKRAPQQKVWHQLRLDIYKEKMLIPGNCTGKGSCLFVCPWIPDEFEDPFEYHSELNVDAMSYGKEKLFLVVIDYLRSFVEISIWTIICIALIYLMIPNYNHLSRIYRIANTTVTRNGEVIATSNIEELLELPELLDGDGENELVIIEEVERDNVDEEENDTWIHDVDDIDDVDDVDDFLDTEPKFNRKHRSNSKFNSPHPPSPSKRSKAMRTSPKNNPKAKFINPKVR